MPTRATETPPSPPSIPPIFLLAVLTFTSGCAALVFQVAWMRELRLVFGATTASVAAVLAIFMAGIGLGSAVLGKWADRVSNPLRMYGLLEIAIALAAAVSPWLIDLTRTIYIGLGGQESLGLWGATVVRLALAAAVMIAPTFLMGGTLPAAVRSVTRATDDHRLALGVLYGSNTLGAVFGSAIATFFALENLGTRATLWVGCALGLSAGAIAVSRARRLAPLPVQEDKGMVDPQNADPNFRPRLIYLAAAVLGFTFFALELVWYRMLGPILGGTAFTFGLILCVALFGIGVGSLAYNFVFRWLQPTWTALAVTCGCEAMFTIIPYALGDQVALWAAWSSQSARTFLSLISGWTLITSIVVLPVAFVSGLQFPLMIALLGHGRRGVSKHLGMTYAWNTLGAIAGSLVAGFGGLPLLTAPGMWLAIALLMSMLSVCVLLGAPQINRRNVAVVGALVLVTIGSMFATGPTAAWRHGGIGAGRAALPPASWPNAVQKWLNDKRSAFIWQADGIECSVGINGGDGLAFIVNGKSDGNALNDAPTQMGVAILGAVLHKDPKTSLVIGMGTGESAGWMAEMRNMERVDVVELEPAIDEMASRCSTLNWDVLRHPRVRRIYNDGREYVFTANDDTKYDVILSEPSNPYRAGVAALYTSEFYQAVRKRLKPGGILIQWLQAYEISDATVGTVLATVGAEFKYVEVWQTMTVDLQLVCSDTPLDYTVEELRERIGSGAVKDALAKSWQVYDVEGFLAHFAAGPGWAAAATQAEFLVPNTDDRTVLEYSFAKSVGRMTQFAIEVVRQTISKQGFHRPKLRDDTIDWNRVELQRQVFNAISGTYVSSELLPEQTDRDLINAIGQYNGRQFAAAIEAWPIDRRHPTDAVQRLILAACYAELGRPECIELLDAEAERHPAETAALRATYHFHNKEWMKAAEAYSVSMSHLATDPWLVPTITDDMYVDMIDVAKANPDAAAMLYESLSKPLAANRSHYFRTITRALVAGQLSPEHVVEAMADFEPHVPWSGDILELRAKSYAAANHPLAARAQRDWEWYQKHRNN